jgi:Ni/Co efflux regulator RcnB
MKRLALAAIAAATFAAPLITSTDAAARDYRRDRHDDRSDRRHDRREDRRDDRRDHRWDDRRYNGFYSGSRWYFGPPPANFRGEVRYDYRGWRRGERLSRYYRDRYRDVDWRHARLRPPPRGYHYIRDDRGDYLLVGIATGVILSVILSQ